MKIQTLGSPTQVSASGKEFMADISQRESARWVEALDLLITWGQVKAVGHKGQIYELTGTGYKKADWLKGKKNGVFWFHFQFSVGSTTKNLV